MHSYLRPPAQTPGFQASAELDFLQASHCSVMDHHPGAVPAMDAGQTSRVGSTTTTTTTAGATNTAEAAAAAVTAMKPIRRRNRMINSCLECRKRKLKCSKTSPSCLNCLKSGRDCLYIGPKLDEASQLRLAEIKEKQGSLERQLERDVAKSTTSKSALQQRILADEVEESYDEDRDLEATPMVALDLTYDDDADGADEMIDLGIQIGKMRITERIGGLSRPRLSEEVCMRMCRVCRLPSAGCIALLVEPYAYYKLCRQLSTGLSGQQQQQPAPPPPPPPPQRPPPPPGYGGPFAGGFPPGLGPGAALDSMSDGGASDMSIPDFLRPSAQYIAPTSGFFFGQVMEQPSLLSFLPHRAAADRLITQYFLSVHPIAPCTHRPTLENIYSTFWDEVLAGYEPRPSMQAIVFAAMFSGAVSMDESDVLRELGGYEKGTWMTNMRVGTETALSKANFLRTTRIETMQAFTMYMVSNWCFV
jgi:hypothetical protein